MMCHDVSNLYITILKTTAIDANNTLQIQNRSCSRVCSNTGVHTQKKNEVFQNLIIFGGFIVVLNSMLDQVPHADAVFSLAKLTVFYTVGFELAGTTTLFYTSPHQTFQKVMCFLPMPLSKSRSNL